MNKKKLNTLVLICCLVCIALGGICTLIGCILGDEGRINIALLAIGLSLIMTSLLVYFMYWLFTSSKSLDKDLEVYYAYIKKEEYDKALEYTRSLKDRKLALTYDQIFGYYYGFTYFLMGKEKEAVEALENIRRIDTNPLYKGLYELAASQFLLLTYYIYMGDSENAGRIKLYYDNHIAGTLLFKKVTTDKRFKDLIELYECAFAILDLNYDDRKRSIMQEKIRDNINNYQFSNISVFNQVFGLPVDFEFEPRMVHYEETSEVKEVKSKKNLAFNIIYYSSLAITLIWLVLYSISRLYESRTNGKKFITNYTPLTVIGLIALFVFVVCACISTAKAEKKKFAIYKRIK